MKVSPNHIETLRLFEDGQWHNVMSVDLAFNPFVGVWKCVRLVGACSRCCDAGLLEEDEDASSWRHFFWVRITDKGRQALREQAEAA